MNNCNCSGLLPLIFGYFTGSASQNGCNCCCNCDNNVMPINNNNFNGFGNYSWLIILLLLCCCGGNNCNCGNN